MISGDALLGCVNTEGSFKCECSTSLYWNGERCTEANECELDTHNCDTNATCTDLVGSFMCSCDSGYVGNGTHCSDVNECAGFALCQTNYDCVNTEGSYFCDEDECRMGSHGCHENAECLNAVGSYECSCSVGWIGNGWNCSEGCK